MVAAGVVERHRRVGLDTMVFIYAFEGPREFGRPCTALLASIRDGDRAGVMSTLVLGELLVRPLRENRRDVALRYVELLGRYPNLEQVPADGAICQLAAELRATTPSLRLPDAIHVATALSHGATALVSFDVRLRNLGSLEVVTPG